MMTHPTPFTYLGFYFNMLTDSGAIETIDDVKYKLTNNTLFEYINEKYADNFDTSLFTMNQLKEIEDYFAMMADAIDEERKMGISNNGLCLLVAYCLQAAQTKEINIHPYPSKLYDKSK